MSYVEDARTSADWEAIASAEHHDPHSVLGAHPIKDAADHTVTVVRARRPLASSVEAVFADGSRLALDHVAHGIWEAQHAYRRSPIASPPHTATTRSPSRAIPTATPPHSATSTCI